MKNDRINNEISIIKEEKSNLWTAFLVTLSGTLALILDNHKTTIKLIFVIVGLLLSVFLFYSYLKKNDQIEPLLNKLEKE